MNLDFGFRIEVLRGIDFLIILFLHIILAWMVAVFVNATATTTPGTTALYLTVNVEYLD